MDASTSFRNVLEVAIPPTVDLSLHELRARYTLLFDLVTSSRLVIRKPCNFACFQFISELLMYAKRNRLCTCNYYASGPNTWFRCEGEVICPDFCISEKASAEESIIQANEQQQSKALEGVDILVTLQFYDTDEDAMLGVKWQADVTGSAAVGMVVWNSTVFVAYYGGQQDSGVKVEKLLKPRFIDMTVFVPRLPGMRLYPSHTAFTLWKDDLFRPELLDLTTEKLRSALLDCIQSGQMETASEIVFLLETLNFVDTVHGKTPLLLALEQPKRDTAFIKLLVDNGADANFKAKNGMWPYLYATYRGMQEELQLLVDGDCKLSPKDLFTNDLEVLCMVLSLEQVPLNEQHEGRVFLVDAMCRPRCLERVQLLLAAGADPTIRDENGHSALSYAAIVKEDVDVLRVVAQACRDRNKMDMEVRTGFSTLGLACYYELPEVCSVLLEYGASPHAAYSTPQGKQDLNKHLKMLFALADVPLPSSLV